MIQELSYTLRGYLAVTFLLGTTGRLITYANTHGTQFPAVVTSESKKTRITRGGGSHRYIHR